MKKPHAALLGWVASCACLVFSPQDASAQFQSFAFSSDIAIALGDETLESRQVAEIRADGVSVASLGPLPRSANLDAYHRLSATEHLFSLDVATELPGPLQTLPGDVIRFDGTSYSLAFESRSAGLLNVNVDALTVNSQGDLILSVDSAILIGDITADDEDLLRWDGSALSILLPLDLVQVPGHLDLDAMHRDADRDLWYFSFDTSWQIDGKVFHDEDILRLDILNSIWQVEPHPHAGSPAWAGADLDALHLAPDPSLIFADGFESGSTFYWQ